MLGLLGDAVGWAIVIAIASFPLWLLVLWVWLARFVLRAAFGHHRSRRAGAAVTLLGPFESRVKVRRLPL